MATREACSTCLVETSHDPFHTQHFKVVNDKKQLDELELKFVQGDPAYGHRPFAPGFSIKDSTIAALVVSKPCSCALFASFHRSRNTAL